MLCGFWSLFSVLDASGRSPSACDRRHSWRFIGRWCAAHTVAFLFEPTPAEAWAKGAVHSTYPHRPRRSPAKSLILLFALVVAIIIAGALWETLAWRTIYPSALTCGQEVLRAATPFSGPSPRHAGAGAVTRQPA